jgi:hypothetical protein
MTDHDVPSATATANASASAHCLVQTTTARRADETQA